MGAMPDLALTRDDFGRLDLAFVDDDLALDDGLESSVLLSLFLDRLAETEDQLPSADTNRRGWWGDDFQEPEGDHQGSRWWLLERTATAAVGSALALYAQDALQWMVDDGVAARVVATNELIDDRLCVQVDISRPNGGGSFRFSALWNEVTRAI